MVMVEYVIAGVVRERMYSRGSLYSAKVPSANFRMTLKTEWRKKLPDTKSHNQSRLMQSNYGLSFRMTDPYEYHFHFSDWGAG